MKTGHYENRLKAEVAITILRELFKSGADPNAVKSHSDWRGSGSSSYAFNTALSLTQFTPLKNHDDLSASLIRIFMDAGVDVNKENVQYISSMRADGAIRSTVLHNNIARYSLPIVRELLGKADVDHRMTEKIQHERGYDQDSSKTALHILCSSVKRRERAVQDDRRCLQIANALLEFGADPNSLNSYLTQVPNPEHKEDDERDDPRRDGYIAKVVSERVIEMPLYRALRNHLAPLVYLLINKGASTKDIYIRCSRENFLFNWSGKDCEIQDGLKKFHRQDRRPGDVICSAFEVLQDVQKEIEDSMKEKSPANNINSKEEIDKNLLKFSEEKKAMKAAVRGEWSKSFNPYASKETKNLVGAIQKSRLPGVVQDLVINFVLSMHPFPSNFF